MAERFGIGRVLEFGVIPYVQLCLWLSIRDTLHLFCENSDENFYVLAIV
jgi:hypothetical protein